MQPGEAGGVGYDVSLSVSTTPEGKARIRAIVTSEHTRAQLDRALETMERVARRMALST